MPSARTKKSRFSAAALGLAVLATAMAAPLRAQLPTGIKAEPFYDHARINFTGNKTVWMEEVPGTVRHFWVLCQEGMIFSLRATGSDPNSQDFVKTQLADFKAKVHFRPKSEYGAYSIAFHPAFAENGRFFLIYLAPPPTNAGSEKSGGTIKVEEWLASGTRHETLSYRSTVLTFAHKPAYGTSSMKFGPDGFLYLSLSDYATDGWDLTTWGRKMLRIDVDRKDPGLEYAIPSDNPYVGHPNPAVKKEIWASGIRNGWSFTFDPWNGDMWLGDVGQTEWEELNIIRKGGNYGWAAGGDGESGPWTGFNGLCAQSKHKDSCEKFVDPVYAFPYHSWAPEGNVAGMKCINAGRFFRGDKDSPFYGHLIFADESTDRIVAVKKGMQPQVVGDVSPVSKRGDHDGIAHIAEDSYGNLYAVFISWNATSYQIYQLRHPDLKPLAHPVATLDRNRRLHGITAPELRVHLGPGPAFPGRDASARLFSLDGRSLPAAGSPVPPSAGLYLVKPR
jgi:quinoprotein glucose dehydrogenase